MGISYQDVANHLAQARSRLAKRKADNRATMQRARAKARAEGRCISCRKEPAKDGRVTCVPCLDALHVRKTRYTDEGLCRCGQDRAPGLSRCARCAEHNNALQKQQYAKRRALGLCGRNGCHQPAVEGKSRCPVHT